MAVFSRSILALNTAMPCHSFKISFLQLWQKNWDLVFSNSRKKQKARIVSLPPSFSPFANNKFFFLFLICEKIKKVFSFILKTGIKNREKTNFISSSYLYILFWFFPLRTLTEELKVLFIVGEISPNGIPREKVTKNPFGIFSNNAIVIIECYLRWHCFKL